MESESGKIPLQNDILTCCQDLIDSLPAIIFQVQYHFTGKVSVNYVSDFFEIFFNMNSKGVKNKPEKIFEMIVDDQKTRILNLIRSLRLSPSDIHFRTQVNAKKGLIRQISVSAKLLDTQKHGSVWNGVAIDITEEFTGKKSLESDILDVLDLKKEQKQRWQAQTDETVATWAGGIAHELNNVFSAILGFSELALEEALPGSILHENIEEVMIAGERAKKLVKKLSEFTKQMKPPAR